MKYVKLGSSGLEVSRVCLGSMTWGQQNNQQDADAQLDYAQTQGINFIDTAEMYAVPPSKETCGKTEMIIGNWLTANPSRRKEIVLATKMAGPGLPYIRGGAPATGKALIEAVEGSLKRLQTDYIDLYQLHWPSRMTPHFGGHWPGSQNHTEVNAVEQTESMLDILQGLANCVKAGKIRYCGLSNETPWGLNQYLRLSEQHNLPRMVSMQNEFNLLHHKDWPYLLENCVHEDIAYLPWSPLASGMLTGKYANGAFPEGSRWTFSQRNGLFRDTEAGHKAVAAYVDVAQQHGISPAKVALGWCDQVPGVTSTIIGATSMTQLEQDIEAFSEPLSAEIITDITGVLKAFPAPF
ncbi:MAG: aryl-alcohol dehydrogenase-like predicted oxidoreductase [Phenylobacterium sp.]|jgi:aryl-alcohol dehydrogenase-like predicted oxidoreductase